MATPWLVVRRLVCGRQVAKCTLRDLGRGTNTALGAHLEKACVTAPQAAIRRTAATGGRESMGKKAVVVVVSDVRRPE